MISVPTYLVLHLSAIFVLLGYTFYAFAAPVETKRRTMMVTGIAALVILVTGMGLMARQHLAFQGWLAVKIVCWLGLVAMGSFAYRRRDLRGDHVRAAGLTGSFRWRAVTDCRF